MGKVAKTMGAAWDNGREDAMNKPSPALLALHMIGVIGKIEIDYRHMHTPKGATYVRLHGNIGSLDGRWDEYEPYLDLAVEWNSVARIKDEHRKVIEAWWMGKAQRDKEMAEYERLGKKLGKR